MTERKQRFDTWPTDITALIARIAVGVVFIAHGLQKIETGVDNVAQGFQALGIPLPEAAAVLAIVIEVGGGFALIVGFVLPAAGVALAAFMVGAYSFVHTSEGLVDGYEFVLVLGAAALALGFAGGSFAVDRLLPWNRFLPWSRVRTESVRAAA